jgi:transcriptional regulator with XRE-family HTH domain
VPAEPSPTVRRRELGALLRSLRLRAGLSVDEVTQHLLCSPAKISRLESGQRGVSARDIRDLCALYGVTDPAQKQHLSALAREGKEKAWWDPFDLPAQLSRYIGLEADAVSISVFDGGCVPGLLQTQEYIRAMLAIEEPPFTEAEIKERVASRLKRQELLTADNAPRVEIILDEAVLQHVVGSDAIMSSQLERLLQDAELQNVTIRVIPFAAGARSADATSFTILAFEPEVLHDVVYLEQMTGGIFLEDEADSARYRRFFDRMTAAALTPEESRAFIAAKIRDYQPRVLSQDRVRC